MRQPAIATYSPRCLASRPIRSCSKTVRCGSRPDGLGFAAITLNSCDQGKSIARPIRLTPMTDGRFPTPKGVLEPLFPEYDAEREEAIQRLKVVDIPTMGKPNGWHLRPKGHDFSNDEILR